MKKFTLTLLAVVMSVLLAFSLVACNGGGNDGDNSSNSSNSTNSTGDTTDAAKVTAQQWLTAFDTANNFTYEIVEGEVVEQTIALDGAKLMMSTYTMTYIYVQEGSEYCVYRFQNDAWLKMPLTADEYAMVTSMTTQMVAIFKNDYSSFTFVDGVYTCASLDKTAETNGVLKNIKIEFSDGAITGIEFNVDGYTELYKVSKIGSTVIELPTDFTEFDPSSQQPQKMSEAAWQQAFMAFAAGQNFSLTQSDNEGVFAAMKLDGATYYETYRSGSEYIYDFDGSNFYKYSKSVYSDWVKVDSTQDEYNEVIEYASTLVMGAAYAISASYDLFEYQNGKYVASTITIADGFVLENVELTFDDNMLVGVTCTWVDGNSAVLIDIYNVGTTEIDIPGENSNAKNTEVNDKEWYVAFESANNFTMTMVSVTDNMLIKLDGDKMLMEAEGQTVILNKEGADYVSYIFMYEQWFKAPAQPDMLVIFTLTDQIVAYFANCYNSFTYSNGKYVCASLDTGDDNMGVLKNVEVVFENGKIVSVVFDVEEESLRVEITDVGSTTVEIPAKYTDISEMM